MNIKNLKYLLNTFADNHDLIKEIYHTDAKIDYMMFEEVNDKYFISFYQNNYINFGKLELIEETDDEDYFTYINHNTYFTIEVQNFINEKILMNELVTQYNKYMKKSNIKNNYSVKYILDTLKKLEIENIVPKDFAHSTRQYIFVDSMIPYEDDSKPGIGNKYAFQEFIKENRVGYYVSMDANDFKNINKINHIIGDEAIISIGKALRDASYNTGMCKLFRSGGDEFLLFTEIKGNVDIFIQNAIKELDKIERVNDLYKLTVSFGAGNSYYDAEESLKMAKNKKIIATPNLVYSSI